MDDIIHDFLMETAESLEQLDVDLVPLEQGHNNTELKEIMAKLEETGEEPHGDDAEL